MGKERGGGGGGGGVRGREYGLVRKGRVSNLIG